MWTKSIIFVLLFSYTFAFYIENISISILISIPLYIYSLTNSKYRVCIKTVICKKIFVNIFKFLFLIISLGIYYPIIYETYDFSLLKIFIIHIIHFAAAFPVLAYLSYKNIKQEDVEMQFICIFILQTIIQFVAVYDSSIREKMFYFNHYESDRITGIGSNIRGVALSAATTYHLTLAYGIAYIIYLKRILQKDISIITALIGIVLLSGIFCAGRSGFVGFFIGIIGFFMIEKNRIYLFTKYAIYNLIVVCVSLLLIAHLMPLFYELLENSILPYAFEFIYNQQESGAIETQSTNQLLDMWHKNFNIEELIFGLGKFTNNDGSYYMRVDPGVLRHMLFGGIFFYVVLIVYQYSIMPFRRMKGMNRYFISLIFLYIFLLDFKGVSIGGNKFMVFIPLLLSYTYLYLPKYSNRKI